MVSIDESGSPLLTVTTKEAFYYYYFGVNHYSSLGLPKLSAWIGEFWTSRCFESFGCARCLSALFLLIYARELESKRTATKGERKDTSRVLLAAVWLMLLLLRGVRKQRFPARWFSHEWTEISFPVGICLWGANLPPRPSLLLQHLDFYWTLRSNCEYIIQVWVCLSFKLEVNLNLVCLACSVLFSVVFVKYLSRSI